MKKIHKGKIKNIQKTALDTYKIEFASNLDCALPGQFVSVLCPQKTLRRPFSIAGFKDGVLEVLFKLKGDGTSYIKSLKIGDEIDFLGPLGSGFKIQNKKSLLVGAGIGIAPMLFLKNTLEKQGIENFLISGFKSEEERIEGSNKAVVGGSVLDYLPQIITDFKPEIIYSCGPEIVLKNVGIAAQKYNLECQIALEKVFACQVGVCRGCVIKILKDGVAQNATICHDGPVFEAKEVVWE